MQTFNKKERLTEKKIIQVLFDKGNEFFIPPFRVLWRTNHSDEPFTAKILIAVSNKNFKRAVDRNRIRRIVREAYRKNKQILYDYHNGKSDILEIVLTYTGKIILDYKETESKIILVLKRLLKHYEEGSR